jgi:hypothetical protein
MRHLGVIVRIYSEVMAKMFHVKHLRCPFAGKDFTQARGKISPLRAQQLLTTAPACSARVNEVVEERKTRVFLTDSKLRGQVQASLKLILYQRKNPCFGSCNSVRNGFEFRREE